MLIILNFLSFHIALIATRFHLKGSTNYKAVKYESVIFTNKSLKNLTKNI